MSTPQPTTSDQPRSAQLHAHVRLYRPCPQHSQAQVQPGVLLSPPSPSPSLVPRPPPHNAPPLLQLVYPRSGIALRTPRSLKGGSQVTPGYLRQRWERPDKRSPMKRIPDLDGISEMVPKQYRRVDIKVCALLLPSPAPSSDASPALNRAQPLFCFARFPVLAPWRGRL